MVTGRMWKAGPGPDYPIGLWSLPVMAQTSFQKFQRRPKMNVKQGFQFDILILIFFWKV